MSVPDVKRVSVSYMFYISYLRAALVWSRIGGADVT